MRWTVIFLWYSKSDKSKSSCHCPTAKKNIVHGTCATGERKHDDDRYFCRWSCALGFCYYRHGMRKYMNLVRVMASKQGFIGIIPIPPDPTRVLKRNNPCLKGTIEETDAQFHKWIDEGMQVVEQRDSAISSARVFKLHKQQAELRPGRTVLELTDVNNPDLSEEYAITEKEVEGDPTQRLGMYRQHLNAKAKGGSKSKKTNVQSKSKKPASSSKRKSNSGSKKNKIVLFLFQNHSTVQIGHAFPNYFLIHLKKHV